MRVKLKNFEVINLLTAIQLLDNPDKLRENGSSAPIKPFKFSGETVLKLVKNTKILKTHREEIEETRKKVVEKYKTRPEDDAITDINKQKEFIKEYEDFLNLEDDFDLKTISYSDLNIDENKNNIPASIVEELLDRVVLEDEVNLKIVK